MDEAPAITGKDEDKAAFSGGESGRVLGLAGQTPPGWAIRGWLSRDSGLLPGRSGLTGFFRLARL